MTQAYNDECERELEREEEAQEEIERVVPVAKPCDEKDWAFPSALAAASAAAMPPAAGVLPLSEALTGGVGIRGAAEVAWSPLVHCTRNFIDTMASAASAASGTSFKDEYLRIPDVILL
jgi:hypothetical protein